eukprot:6177895-Pleurochrysis_carterae.AAC.2
MSDSEQTYELGFTRLVSSACRPPSWLWRLMVASFLEQILASRQARKQHNGCIPPPPQDTASVCTFPIVPPTRSLPLMRKSTAVALDLRQTLRHAQSRSLALQACSLRAMKLLLSCMFSVDAYLSSWMSTTMRYATGGLRLCQETLMLVALHGKLLSSLVHAGSPAGWSTAKPRKWRPPLAFFNAWCGQHCSQALGETASVDRVAGTICRSPTLRAVICPHRSATQTKTC